MTYPGGKFKVEILGVDSGLLLDHMLVTFVLLSYCFWLSKYVNHITIESLSAHLSTHVFFALSPILHSESAFRLLQFLLRNQKKVVFATLSGWLDSIS